MEANKELNYTAENIKFAEFLGAVYISDKQFGDDAFMRFPNNTTKFSNGSNIMDVVALDYDESFSSLMMVVEKIENLKINLNINVIIWGKRTTIEVTNENKEVVFFTSESFGSKHESVYKACNKFVNWYIKLIGEFDDSVENFDEKKISQVSFLTYKSVSAKFIIDEIRKYVPDLHALIEDFDDSYRQTFLRSDSLNAEQLLKMCEINRQKARINKTRIIE